MNTPELEKLSKKLDTLTYVSVALFLPAVILLFIIFA